MNNWPIRSSWILGEYDGASLLEVLVAMAILSIVLLGMAGFATVAIKGASFSQKMTVAATLAQDAMEEVRREGYQPDLFEEISHTESYGTLPRAAFFERTLLAKPHTPSPGLQTVTVTVAWDSGKHSTSLSTILGE